MLAWGVCNIGGCSVLPEGTDLQEVMETLIRFAAQEESLSLQSAVMNTTTVVLRADAGRNFSVPVEDLSFAVEEGRTDFVRSRGLRTLARLAEDDNVRAYLLRWARAERGPPLFPDLPEQIADRLYYIESIVSADLLRAALESDLSQVRNAKVRCLVENRGNPLDGIARRCPGW